MTVSDDELEGWLGEPKKSSKPKSKKRGKTSDEELNKFLKDNHIKAKIKTKNGVTTTEIQAATEDNFKPVQIDFPEITIINSTKYELNYVAIRRKIIEIGKSIKLIREPKPEALKTKYLDDKAYIKFNYKFYFNNLWSKYCVAWNNSRINKIFSRGK